MVDARTYNLDLMIKIAEPILKNLSSGRLKQVLPVNKPGREPYACLEAFGRTACGISPWLELDGLEGDEAVLQSEYRELMRESIDAATAPESRDRMNFSEGYGQSLVDAAFLAEGMIRAPREMSYKLEPRVKKNLADALRSTRKFMPYNSNWLFFSAEVEAGLLILGEDYDIAPVKKASEAFERWYVGDGAYGDGKMFHFDYYNSFVIHPMYVDVLSVFANVDSQLRNLLPKVKRRASRHAAVLERLIAPDGSYPIVGRSVCYRFGAFHALAQAVLIDNLPENLPPAQVRSALTAAVKKTADGGLFDENGFLRVGVYGLQPDLAEDYISTGSLYLCEAAFLGLGLSPLHPYWSGEDLPWTSKRIWSGENIPRDKAED